jgi:hypothetical protein
MPRPSCPNFRQENPLLYRAPARRIAVSLLAVFLLATAVPTAVAAGPRRLSTSGRAAGPRGEVFSTVDLFSSLLPSWVADLIGSWAKNGCSIDPSGACAKAGTVYSGGQAGCSIDPSGCSGATSNVENGCSIDPDGRCNPGH